jgi:hypothetical protein
MNAQGRQNHILPIPRRPDQSGQTTASASAAKAARIARKPVADLPPIG